MTNTLHTEAPNKLYGLDHLRALAIIIVMLFHYQRFLGHPEWFPQMITFGWTGVDLFFVLSGFLIASQLFGQIKNEGSFSVKEFYLKRFFRIIPVYLVVVGIYFCFPFFREKEALPPLWKFLTFTQNFGIHLKEYGTFSHAWSLCVEEHFYLFFPLILIIFQRSNFFRKSYWALLFLFFLSFIIRLYCWNNIFISKINDPSAETFWLENIYYPAYNRLDGLLVGVSIAAFYQYLPRLFDKVSAYGNLFIMLGIAVVGGVYFFYSAFMTLSTTLFSFPLISIGYGLIVLGALSPTSFLYRWNSATTSFIATLSYAIYLSHKGIIHIGQKVFSNWGIDKNSSIMLLVCFIFSVAVAWVLNLAIEKPFMKMRKQFIHK